MSVQSVIEGKITFPPLDLDPVGLAPMSVEYGLWPGTRLTAPYARRPWLKFSLDERGRACGLECNPEVTEWGWGAHWGSSPAPSQGASSRRDRWRTGHSPSSS